MSSLGFGSLEELWGDNYSNHSQENNEKNGLDYTGGNVYETALEPIMDSNEQLMLQEDVGMRENRIVPVQNKINPVENATMKLILEKIDERIKKLETMCNKRDQQILEGFSNSSTNYFDLLILIGLGILIIYVLDSIMKMAKK